MTTIAIIALIVLFVLESVLLARMSRVETEVRDIRSYVESLADDLVAARKEIIALADVVADNADRCTRLESEDAPRRPASPATYLATTYPKRADEV